PRLQLRRARQLSQAQPRAGARAHHRLLPRASRVVVDDSAGGFCRFPPLVGPRSGAASADPTSRPSAAQDVAATGEEITAMTTIDRRRFLGSAGVLGAAAVLADGLGTTARADKPVSFSGWVFKPD